MRPRSPILTVLLCLIIVSSVVGIPFVDNAVNADGSLEVGDPTGSAPILTTATHLMTRGEMEELKAHIGVYDGNRTTEAVESTGLRAPTGEEWEAMVGTKVMVDSVESTLSAYPESVDLSLSEYFPAVGDQGQFGSCAAWAETYYSLGYLVAEANGWSDASLGNPEHLLSPLWTYNLHNKGNDLGSYLGENTNVSASVGAATLGTMPYGTNVTAWGSEEAWREAPSYKAGSFYTIGYNEATELSTIKALLASGTPVVFSICASNFTANYVDGLGNRNNILSSSEYHIEAPNHLQTIVGYDDNMGENGEEGVFKLANSWGTEFGEDGYYYITYDTFMTIADPVVGQGEIGYVVLDEEETTALGVWHFDAAPGRDASINVSAVSVSTGDTLATVEPYIRPYAPGNPIHEMPSFMCLDISNLSAYLGDPTAKIVLTIGSSVIHYPSGGSPEVSSFRVEEYFNGYDPGHASTISDQASGLPAATPCSVALAQRAPIEVSATDALDWQYGALSSAGTAQWVGVDLGNGSDSSFQSGDVGDLSRSMFIAFVYGPGTISFDWSVSSEDTYDHLRFYVDGVLIAEISGEVDWARAEYSLPAGLHKVTWSYEKDEYVSAGDDCGWVDNVDWSGLAVVRYEGFEGDMSGWTVSDSDAVSGADTWGISDQRSNSGRTSAWCAASGNGSNGYPNQINGYYDTYMGALMVMPLPDLTDLGGVQLSFYYWAETGGSSLTDHLSIEAFTVSDGWTEVWSQQSVSTSGWVSAQVGLSNDVTMLRFCFNSDGSAGGYEGVYLDDILVTYADVELPTSSVNALSEYATSSSLSLDCTVADGAIIWDGHLQIYYRIGGSGDYVLYTTASNPSGMWSGTTVDFKFEEVGGSEGLYQFYSIAVDGAGNVEATPLVYDARTTFDSIAPTTNVSPTGDGVPIDAKIVVEFSEPMNLSSITIIVSNSVEGDVVFVGNVATYTPNALKYNTEYTVTVVGKDLAGNAVERSWTFSTIEVGKLEGIVVDEDGNVLANATVTLNNNATTMTDANGRFVFENVTSGSYTLTIEKDGYVHASVDVTVEVDETVNLGQVVMTLTSNDEVSVSDSTLLLVGVVTIMAIIALAGVFLFMKRRK
jgi:hypothetical protein